MVVDTEAASRNVCERNGSDKRDPVWDALPGAAYAQLPECEPFAGLVDDGASAWIGLFSPRYEKRR